MATRFQSVRKGREVRRDDHRLPRAAAAVVEVMERRTLLSAVLGADGTLTVNGTGGADNISLHVELEFQNNQFSGTVGADVNGVTSTFDASKIKQIHVNGLGGNDTINETGTVDGDRVIATTLSGGDGNDTINDFAGTNNGADYVGESLDGGAGNDVLHADVNAHGHVTLNGGDGNDDLTDGTENGSALELGGSGDDLFHWFEDASVTVRGGAGNDTFDTDLASAGGPLWISLNAVNAGGNDGVINAGTDVENVIVPKGFFTPIKVDGNGSANHITVDDQGIGDVIVNGGGGNDVISVENALNATLSGGDGNDSIIDSSTSNDHASLNGGSGNDVLKGGNERDLMDGGAGADQFSGGGGTDIADYHTRTSNLVVWLDGTHPSGQSGENDHFDGTVEIVYGGSGNDYLVGTTGNNALYGNGGNDTLWGGGGVDAFFGGAGNDQIHSKDGNKDFVDGGPGNDSAVTDPIDTVVNVETVTH